VICKGILGKNSEFLGESVVSRPYFMAAWLTPRPFSTLSFVVAFYLLGAQCSYCGTVKF
jgi:hypothetical protein